MPSKKWDVGLATADKLFAIGETSGVLGLGSICTVARQIIDHVRHTRSLASDAEQIAGRVLDVLDILDRLEVNAAKLGMPENVAVRMQGLHELLVEVEAAVCKIGREGWLKHIFCFLHEGKKPLKQLDEEIKVQLDAITRLYKLELDAWVMKRLEARPYEIEKTISKELEAQTLSKLDETGSLTTGTVLLQASPVIVTKVRVASGVTDAEFRKELDALRAEERAHKREARKMRFAESQLNEMEVAEKQASRVDLAFLVDITSSMNVYIEHVKEGIGDVIRDIEAKYPHLRLRVAFVGYRDHAIDPTMQNVIINFPGEAEFDGHIERFRKEVGMVRANGGDDWAEDVASGLRDALHKLDWLDRKHTSLLKSPTRAIFHIADAASHGSIYYDLEEIVEGSGHSVASLIGANNKPHPGIDELPDGDHGIPELLIRTKNEGIDYYFGKLPRDGFHGATDQMVNTFNEMIARGATGNDRCFLRDFVQTVDLSKGYKLKVLTDAVTASLRKSIATSMSAAGRKTKTVSPAEATAKARREVEKAASKKAAEEKELAAIGEELVRAQAEAEKAALERTAAVRAATEAANAKAAADRAEAAMAKELEKNEREAANKARERAAVRKGLLERKATFEKRVEEKLRQEQVAEEARERAEEARLFAAAEARDKQEAVERARLLEEQNRLNEEMKQRTALAFEEEERRNRERIRAAEKVQMEKEFEAERMAARAREQTAREEKKALKANQQRERELQAAKAVAAEVARPPADGQTRKTLRRKAAKAEDPAPTSPPTFTATDPFFKASLMLTKPPQSLESIKVTAKVMPATPEALAKASEDDSSSRDLFALLAQKTTAAAEAIVGAVAATVDSGLAIVAERVDFVPSSLNMAGKLLKGEASHVHVRIADSKIGEGGMRQAFHGQMSTDKGNKWEPVVFKSFLQDPDYLHDDDDTEEDKQENILDTYMACAESSSVAEFLANKFNEEKKPKAKIKFIESSVVFFKATPGQKTPSYYFVEKPLAGDFIKWTSNHEKYFAAGDFIDLMTKDPDATTLLEFMLYTARVTNKYLMVVDIQGVKTTQGGGSAPQYLLTDPAICCQNPTRFGGPAGGNLGPENIDKMNASVGKQLDRLRNAFYSA